MEQLVNKEQVKGKVKQGVGKVKQSVGEVVGNLGLANRGVVDQAAGAAAETFSNTKEAAQQIRGTRRKAAVKKSDQVRHMSARLWKRWKMK